VAAVDQAVIEQALKLPYHDLKSTLQMMAAVETGQTQSGAGGAERGVVDAIQQSK
jgi:nitrogenase subunit NifH